MKIIDAHVHIGLNKFCLNKTISLPYNLENAYEKFSEIIKEYNLEKVIALPITDSNIDISKSHIYLKEANIYNSKIIPFCRLDDNLMENLQDGFYGAKYHMVYENIIKKDIREYYKIIEYLEKPIIIHALYKDKVKQIKEILSIAPNLNIILAHMGRGHVYTSEGVIDNLNGLKKFENVKFETSTIGDSEIIEKACNIVGKDRIIFGSDYPFGKAVFGNKYTYKDEIDVVLNSKINDESKESIFYSNINNLIKTIDTNISIIKYNSKYKEQVIRLLENMNEEDTKYLAISNKWDVIKNNLRNERHIYIAIVDGKVVGYLRESGREKGYSLLEEIAVDNKYRKKGIANKLLDFYLTLFPLSLAKSNSKNIKINSLLRKKGYIIQKGTRIYNWIR